jgi:hypothetical protein
MIASLKHSISGNKIKKAGKEAKNIFVEKSLV